MRLLRFSLAAASAAALVAVPAAVGQGQRSPDTIRLPNGWQPEGIASGAGDALFVGSIPTGRVLRINARTGRSEVLVRRRQGRAAIGLKVSDGRIFVAGGPTGRAFVYSSRTGADLGNVRLTTGPTFVNDVTVTRRAAYFTDSQKPQLYRLGLNRRGAASDRATAIPFTGDLQYDEDPETFEANGIAAAPDGSLLVVQSRTASLFKVDPRSGASRRVALTGGDRGRLENADGILRDGRTLYVVQNRSNRIAVVRLAADLRSGRIVRTLRDGDFDVPTTVARKGSFLYAVNARFGTDPTSRTRTTS
jgi:sugar lactone lactonase YvrE